MSCFIRKHVNRVRRSVHSKLNRMHNTLTSVFQDSALLSEAAYILGYTLVKHHKPVSFAEPMVNVAVSCDPESKLLYKDILRASSCETRLGNSGWKCADKIDVIIYPGDDFDPEKLQILLL